ncbi:MAG: hypothetical protein AAGN35_06435 [Bacteroidota bacterium]
MRGLRLFFGCLVLGLLGCNHSADSESDREICTCEPSPENRAYTQRYQPGRGALLATRFSTLDEFKHVVQIEHLPTPTAPQDTATAVRLRHCSHGQALSSLLTAGISQKDITKAKASGFWAQLKLLFRAPEVIGHRADLKRIYVLARRRPLEFGEGDIAFFDFAETMVANINTFDLAFRFPRDTTEKGYLNTFNHINAQAFLTSIFSEELADYVADLHERKNMPELITGVFSDSQLTDPNNNPVDNYVDMVNNEWGQELGKQLGQRYGIDRRTQWSPQLLADYLNDLQAYYTWAFNIGFRPYVPEDELVITFAVKLNHVLDDAYPWAET